MRPFAAGDSTVTNTPNADVKVLGAGDAFGDVGELAQEPSPSGYFEEHVGQVDPGQEIVDRAPQGEQAGRLDFI